MNRKDDHLLYAMTSTINHNSFDDMIFVHQSLPKYSIGEIDITTSFCGYSFSCPFYINAMTGGSNKAKKINQRLAKIAQKCDLFIATGSYSAAIKNPETKDSFNINSDNNITATNIGVDKPVSYFHQAITETNAKIIQIHLNVLQEILMNEGDHNFNCWEENLKNMINQSPIPVIVKEVGFGMDYYTIKTLVKLGAKTIDISGKGGTNFAYIENMRNPNPLNYLNHWGISTVNSLLESKPFQDKCEILASGGVRNALDIVKCLVLGAKGVGISRLLLDYLEYDDETVISKIEQLKTEIKKIMVLLNIKKLEDLPKVRYYLINETLDFYNQITKEKV